MIRDANLIKQAVQLANTCIDLLGQVTCVHGGGGDDAHWTSGYKGI